MVNGADLGPDEAARRPLPAGYDDEAADTFIPRPLRSHYQTVTAPTDDYATVIDAVAAWVERDHDARDRRHPR